MKTKQTKVGTVEHFFDKISVAAIVLSAPLSTGDRIKFVRGGEDLFDQMVESMQIEHKIVKKAGKGDDVGLKVDKPVRQGAEVFRLDEE